MLYKECRDQVNTLFSYVKTHIDSEFDYRNDIEKMISDSEDESKHYLIDDAFIALCYVINNSDYTNISTSFSIRDFDFGGLNRMLLEMLYDCYEKNISDATPEEIFPEQCQIFTKCNTTFLQPGDNVVSSPPKGARVVKFNIKNCKNMIFDSRSVLDNDYIKSQFEGLTRTTGVNEKIIKRFEFLKKFKAEESPNDYIIDDIEDVIYQKLDDGNYRELSNSKIQERDYNLINFNLAITNWENKRMLALRQTIPKPIRSINFDAIRGSIKSNIYDHNMKIADAVFNSYKNPNLSDNDILQILVGSQIYQDKHRFIKRADFDKLFSIRDLEANII